MHKLFQLQQLQYFIVCLFFMSFNFEVYAPLIPNFSVAKMIAVVYMIISLFSSFETLFSVKYIKNSLIYAFCMFFVMVLSSLIHKNIQIWSNAIFLNIIMFWLLLNHYRRDHRIFKDGFFCFVISSGVVGILYLFNVGVSVSWIDGRMTMFGDNANAVGSRMALASLIILDYGLNRSELSRGKRLLLLLLLFPIGSLLVATASRMSFIIFLLGIILFILLKPMRSMLKKIIWLLGGIIIIYWGWNFISQQEILMGRLQESIEEGNLSGRDYIWEKYIEVIKMNPLLGVGFSGISTYAKNLFGVVMSPHNVIIEVLLFSGIIGFSFFSLFMLCIIKNVYKRYVEEKAVLPILFLIMIIANILVGHCLGYKWFWAISAYIISYQIPINKYINTSYKS